MKKIILLTLIFSTSVGFSQLIKFGAKAGVNYNNYSPDIEGTESQIAYHFGGYIEYSFNERNDVFFLRPEFLYSVEGFKYATSGVEQTTLTPYSLEKEVNVNYLSIPILGKYRKWEKVYLESGPQINFLISAKEDNSYVGSSGNTSNDNVDVRDEYKPVKISWVAGVGYLITENLSISARTAISFTEIREGTSENTNEYTREKLTNSIVQFSIGYTF
jgi:hypothetical protein